MSETTKEERAGRPSSGEVPRSVSHTQSHAKSSKSWPRGRLSEAEKAAYESFVAEMARKADGSLFLNHDVEHAEIVLAQLFKSAVSEVKILTDCLSDDLYGSDRVRNAAVAFASRYPDAKLRILCEEPIETSRLLDSLRGLLQPDNLSVQQIATDVEGNVHFEVVDDRHFRYEKDTTECEAVVAFGKNDFGQRLSSLFDNMACLSA